MRISLDRRQAQELARLIMENGDRIQTLHISTVPNGSVQGMARAEIADADGRIPTTARAWLRPARVEARR